MLVLLTTSAPGFRERLSSLCAFRCWCLEQVQTHEAQKHTPPKENTVECE